MSEAQTEKKDLGQAILKEIIPPLRKKPTKKLLEEHLIPRWQS